MSAITPETLPEGAPGSTAISARAAAGKRRRAAASALFRSFLSQRAGVIGAIVLVIIIVIALLAPVIAPLSMLDVTQLLNQPRFAPPSFAHPLGTDHLGRELWARMVWGSRTTLIVGVAATVMSMVIGTLIGMAAGHFTGLFGGIIMRFVDFFLVLPSLVLAIVLGSVLSRSVWTIVIAIGLTSWAGTARLVRAQTLSIEARGYVERARVLGAGDWRIIGTHVFPAVLPLVLANTTLTVGSAIIAESTLAFLGIGSGADQSWGTILKDALGVSAATSGYWWYVIVPGVAIVVIVLAFTLVGRALETATNPTLAGARPRAKAPRTTAIDLAGSTTPRRR